MPVVHLHTAVLRAAAWSWIINRLAYFVQEGGKECDYTHDKRFCTSNTRQKILQELSLTHPLYELRSKLSRETNGLTLCDPQKLSYASVNNTTKAQDYNFISKGRCWASRLSDTKSVALEISREVRSKSCRLVLTLLTPSIQYCLTFFVYTQSLTLSRTE